MALEELDLSVDTAVNGEEALHMLAGKSYALILLDHNLTQNGCIIGPFASNSFALDSSYLADL